MTWHLGRRLSAVILIVAAQLAAGCGSSSDNASIELSAPEKGAQLTLKADDLDPDEEGLQYDVKATSTGMATGTVVLLTIEGETNTALTMVMKDGSIVFEKVTLPPGKHTLQVATATKNVRSAGDYDYTYKALVIDSPKDGTPLGIAEDKDTTAEGLQLNVSVSAYAVEPSEQITLQVDGEALEKKATANPMTNKALFTGVTLSNGSHTLKAIAGAVESNTVRVTVNGGCATVDWVMPAKPASGADLTLGGANCPEGTEDYTIPEVVVSTDAGENRDVELKVNGQTVKQTKVKGALARFSDVVLNHFTSENTLEVVVQGAQGVTCDAVPFPSKILLDCGGPDCSIKSPMARSGTDAEGQQALYINGSNLDGAGFEIKVHSSESALGKEVQLIIDRDSRRALKEQPVESGNASEATFGAVKLDEGAHTIEAQCTDSAGNVRYSGELSWIVDTKACTLDIEEPETDTRFVTGDDVDDNTSGTQVDVKTAVGGDDCARNRAHVCKPADGIGDVTAFEPWDGNATLITPVTLENSADQTLCVEVEDRAGNRALASVDVHYRSDMPLVKIDKPANNTKYNIGGGDGFTADSDSSSPTVCNADFEVQCSELDVAVELHRGSASATVFATANCVAPGDGDAPLESGYRGRARFSDVAFLVPGNDAANVIATQSVSGSSEDKLVGSASVNLSGVCNAPNLTWADGCPKAQIEIPQNGTVQFGTRQAMYAGPQALAPTMAKLTVNHSASGVDSTEYTANYEMPNRWYRFMDVVYGNTPDDTVTAVLTATDAYKNTSTLECTSKLVTDLPEMTLTAPADNSEFGPGEGCNTGGASFGVRFEADIDQTNMRSLVYQVGSGTEQNVPLDDADGFCVPVAEGSNSVKITLRANSGGSVEVTRNLTVRSLRLVTPLPANGQTEATISTDCGAGSDFGVAVQVTADPIHNGKAVTIGGGLNNFQTTVAGGAVDVCVPFAAGQHTLTVSIDGTQASVMQAIAVITGAPTFGLPISQPTILAKNDANYRSTPVSLSWDVTGQQWSTQLKSYELRCASTQLMDSAAQPDKDTWWTNANIVALPNGVTPPMNTASIPNLHYGQVNHCVIRGKDAANNLTAIGGSTAVDYSFREKNVVLAQPQAGFFGAAVAQVGDVNGDGRNDVLVGSWGAGDGTSSAYLYFGRAEGVTLPDNPDVTIIGGSATTQINLEFATRLTGLGDFNGDGLNDFAIGYPSYSGANGGNNVDAGGALYVFYGRADWGTQPLDVTSTTTCNASVCFLGDESVELFGYSLSSAGRFDGDNLPDLAVGSALRDANSQADAGRVYVLLGNAYASGTTVRVPGDSPKGFFIDGTGDVGPGDSASAGLGQAVAGVGNIDGTAGDEVMVSSSGSTATNARLYQLNGRAHNGQAPQLKSIPVTDLALKDEGSLASGFGRQLTALRNIADHSGKTNIPDLAVYQAESQLHVFNVYLGDDNFVASERLRFVGESNTGFGNSIANTYNPGLSANSFGDLDGDSRDEMIVGGLSPDFTAPPTAQSWIVYSDAITQRYPTSNTILSSMGTGLGPAAPAESAVRYVAPVGDITGDGAPDLIVTDPFTNGGEGRVTVLY
jgi:hypothetical protein